MTQDKNFKLYLIDGTARGKIRCTTDNWAGVALKIPKTQIENCADINANGIYFLFGESAVYIGAGKLKSVGDFWEDAIFFTYKENSFDSSSLKFLKDKFTKKIAAANRYEIKSDNEIFSENISEEKASTLEFFASYVETILYIFGYKVFEPPKENNANATNLFYLEKTLRNSNIIIKATCKKTAEGYVVLAGSKISPTFNSDLANIIRNARNIAEINAENILQNDIFFPHPTPASTFAIGKHINSGWELWKTKNGLTLKEFLKRQAAEE